MRIDRSQDRWSAPAHTLLPTVSWSGNTSPSIRYPHFLLRREEIGREGRTADQCSDNHIEAWATVLVQIYDEDDDMVDDKVSWPVDCTNSVTNLTEITDGNKSSIIIHTTSSYLCDDWRTLKRFRVPQMIIILAMEIGYPYLWALRIHLLLSTHMVSLTLGSEIWGPEAHLSLWSNLEFNEGKHQYLMGVFRRSRALKTVP